MIIGIGTPSSKSKIDRMYTSSLSGLQIAQTLSNDMITLPAADGRSIAGAKRPNQERNEHPV
jgi:hypothetical protein